MRRTLDMNSKIWIMWKSYRSTGKDNGSRVIILKQHLEFTIGSATAAAVGATASKASTAAIAGTATTVPGSTTSKTAASSATTATAAAVASSAATFEYILVIIIYPADKQTVMTSSFWGTTTMSIAAATTSFESA